MSYAARDIDARTPSHPEESVAGCVGTDGGDESGGGACPCGGNGLVEALAAGVFCVGIAENRLAWRRMPLDAGHEVEIGAPDDEDLPSRVGAIDGHDEVFTVR